VKPTPTHRMEIMKHKAIFSLHACRTALSLRPPTELKRAEGAQNVTTRVKITHASLEDGDDSVTGKGDSCDCGVMRGGGATPRSGRVRVFALRSVPDEPYLGVVVGMGMSSRLKCTAIMKKRGADKERTLANQGEAKERMDRLGRCERDGGERRRQQRRGKQ
jgi:hypothetical protein